MYGGGISHGLMETKVRARQNKAFARYETKLFADYNIVSHKRALEGAFDVSSAVLNGFLLWRDFDSFANQFEERSEK